MRLSDFLIVGCVVLGVASARLSAPANADDVVRVTSESATSGVVAGTSANADSAKSIEARKLIEIANLKIRKEPNNDKYYAARAQCYADLDEYSEALADINRAIELTAHEQSYFQLRGGIESHLRNYAAASRDFDSALATGPETAKLYLARSGSLAMLGHFNESLRDADLAIKLEPSSAAAYASRGSTKFHLRDYAGAEVDCAKSESLDPQNLWARELRTYLKGLPHESK